KNISRIICMDDGTMVFVYVGACSVIGGATLCHACQTTHILLVNHSIGLLLLSFCYRLYAIRQRSALKCSPRLVWLLCSLLYLPTAGGWYIYFISARSTPNTIKNAFNLTGYVTTFLCLEDPSTWLSTSFIIIFSPSVMATVFVVRRLLLNNIAQTTTTTKPYDTTII
ncbi:hypothetical protein PENTCL1PPCAC_13943, partial [Pristionchus entomophagus]